MLDLTSDRVTKVAIHRKMAEAALKRGSSDDAASNLKEALTLAPEDSALFTELSALFESSEKWYDLIDLLSNEADRQRASGRGESTLTFRAATIWEEKLSSPEAAAELLEKLLAEEPENVAVLGKLSKIYETMGDQEKRRQTVEKAIPVVKEPKERAQLELLLAQLERDVGSDASAEASEAHFERAFELDPEGSSAPVALAGLMAFARARGDHAKEAALLQKMIMASAASVDERRRSALALLEQIRAGELIADEARALLERLAPHLAALGEDPDLLDARAEADFRAERFDEAMAIFQKRVVQLERDRRRRDVARVRQRLAAILERRGDLQGALAELTLAQQIDGAHPATLSSLARIHFGLSDWEKARKLYRQLLLGSLEPQAKADVYLHLGRIHERLGEPQKALGMYELGVEFDGAHLQLKAEITRLRGAK